MIPDSFEIVVTHEHDRVLVSPQGEIDLSTVPLVRQRLEELGGGAERLVLDLRMVGFLDSSGVKLILDELDRHPDLGLIAGPEEVQRVFEVTGLLDRLPFVPESP